MSKLYQRVIQQKTLGILLDVDGTPCYAQNFVVVDAVLQAAAKRCDYASSTPVKMTLIFSDYRHTLKFYLNQNDYNFSSADFVRQYAYQNLEDT